MPEAAVAAPPAPSTTPAPSVTPAAPAVTPASQPAPAHPRERLRSALKKTAEAPSPSQPVVDTPVKSVEQPKAPEKPATDTNIDDDLEPREPATPEKPDVTPATGDKPAEKPADKGKLSPWKLVDTYKNKVLSLEKELAETRSKVSDPQAVESLNKRLEAAEKRRTELEEEIRYVNYAKSEEFVDKYQKPFEDAWLLAKSDMEELNVNLSDGNTRQATVHDLHKLVNMKLGERREAAKAWFGDAADDVMAHVRRIQSLSAAQDKALADAKKTAAERQQRLTEEQTTRQKALQTEIEGHWNRFNSEAEAQQEHLKAKAGDDEWNSRLDRAKAFVEEAWNGNSADPKLTPEQRAEIVRKHAALRNRAIAYSTLKLENKKLKAQLAERDAALKQYTESEPGKGEGNGRATTVTVPSNPMDRTKQALRQYAT